VKILIDISRCDGRGECATVCPKVFAIGDDRFAHVIDHDPDDDVWERVLHAIVACPRDAITIDHDASP
jgi:ferredoxin